MKRLMYMVMALMCVGGFASGGFVTPPSVAAQAVNLLGNGGFEEGAADAPSSWTHSAFDASAGFVWDNTQAHAGVRSVRIDAQTPNDANWLQTVVVAPNTTYILSGWIKTANVGAANQPVGVGANLSLFGTWTHSEGLLGTHDWTYTRLLFNSGNQSEVTIGARLGYWAGTISGSAWFDDLQLSPVSATDPHPNWKILALVYGRTDFSTTDSAGIAHHYVGELTQSQLDTIDQQVRLFVEQDIPALDGGNMVPTLIIRHPAALTQLESTGTGGWWPSPANTAADRDPAFDAVIVIWNTRVTDVTTGEQRTIEGGFAGLTPAMGSGQLYSTLISDAALFYGHRNVFKHEWGHSITFYHDATNTAPKPMVDNHYPGQYVHCGTGVPYVLVDETDAQPIPNSIYNNQSGFTHDYYAGTTALASDPNHCLGITSEAWAAGGPGSQIATPTNLLVNGGFEEDANGDGHPDGWSNNKLFTRSAAMVHSGGFAGAHQSSKNRSYSIKQKLSGLSGGTTYLFDGWLNIPPTRDSFKLSIEIRWRAKNGHQLGVATVSRITKPTDGWREITANLTAPVATASAEVVMKVISLKGPIYVDDFVFSPQSTSQVERASQVRPVP